MNLLSINYDQLQIYRMINKNEEKYVSDLNYQNFIVGLIVLYAILSFFITKYVYSYIYIYI
jgi:hypothetical protein